MTPRLTVLLFSAFLPLLAEAPRQNVQLVTTGNADFVDGRVIRVEGSAGELNIQAWDEPRVEITVTRSIWVKDTKAARDKAMDELKNIQVITAKNGGDLVISTARRRSLRINLDYRIMVPRNSRLVIRHRTGDVVIDGVDGDIDATARAGDIALQLPAAGHYMFDARCDVGGIYSDFAGEHHQSSLVGERFLQGSETGSRKIRLRTGLGGIEIQKEGGAGSGL